MTRLRVGLIGAGAIARRAHLPCLRDAGAEVVAVAAGSGSSAHEMADEYGLVLCDNWPSLLRRDDIDAVVISSPNALHAEQAAAALAAGKHVLIEKPMTTTVPDAEALLSAAALSPCVAMVAHNARFAPLVVEARGVVSTREVTSLRLALRGGGPRVWAPASAWFFDPQLAGGGVLLDLGVHLLDAARFVLSDDLAVQSAVVTRDSGVDVEATVLLTSTRSVHVELTVSWQSAAPGFELVARAGEDELVIRPNLGVPADTVQAAFVRAVNQGGIAEPSVADGLAAVRLARAAYEVAR